MRPIELQLAGFTAYRDEAVVDFRDADLFALTGPTGSGKSSIVDAIVFALYGAVPRYEDRRAVEPVVTLGKNEARIRFDFAVGDDEYRVARVVRRTKTGATTAEARLEHGDVVLASGADEVTKNVEELLGLAYDHFTKAVVLPQGEFARFLHDKPRERQELLRELLDLRVYRRIRDLATERKALADHALAGHQKEIDLLAEGAGSDEEAAAGRVAGLEQVRDAIADIRKQVALVDEQVKDLDGQIGEASSAMTALAIRPPASAGKLVEQIRQADAAVDSAKAAAEKAEQVLGNHEQSIATLPSPEVVKLHLDQQEALAGLLGRRERAAAELDEDTTGVELRRHSVGEAEKAHRAATEALEQLRRAHAAHELAANVRVGEPCPVCGVPIEAIPDVEPIVDLEQAAEEVERCASALDTARSALTAAEVGLARSKTTVDEIDVRIRALRTELDGVPGTEELTKSLDAATRAGQRLDELRRTSRAAVKSLQEAERHRATLAEARTTALGEFHARRDRVAYLEPPPVTDDLAAAWAELTEWAADRAEEAEERLAGLKKDADRLSGERDRLAKELEGHLAVVGSAMTPEEALFAAKRDLESIQEAKRRTRQVAGEVVAETEKRDVAATLSRHLHSNRFESWILEEALLELTVGANQLLDELSSDAYSLEYGKGGFTIVDHRNADQRRSVRTLSGGETFLVSLALALSLSEQLTRMSPQGKLESIILDEGFGTLDAETLDVVASVVQQLAARGITVGLISHVPDLAEQVPTRFAVTKDVGGAHVKRVDA